jgi:hypothetical protein
MMKDEKLYWERSILSLRMPFRVSYLVINNGLGISSEVCYHAGGTIDFGGGSPRSYRYYSVTMLFSFRLTR